MSRHISLYFSLNFSFLLMSWATSDSGSCHCFSAFGVSCSYGNSNLRWRSSLWSLKRGSCGWQQAAAFSLLYHSLCGQAVTSSKRKEKPVLSRDCKTSEAMEIWKRCFKMLFLSGAPGNAPTYWEDLTLQQENPVSLSVYLLPSQVRYHHDLGCSVCFIRYNKHDNWLTFSYCLGWGRGWAIDSCPILSHKGIQSHHTTFV